jgi:hypothetical protein
MGPTGTVGKEYKEMNAVVSEFMASDLTLADVNISLQMNEVLQGSEIKHEDYKQFIQICKKTVNADYVNIALKLNELEKMTNLDYKEILEKAGETYGYFGLKEPTIQCKLSHHPLG